MHDPAWQPRIIRRFIQHYGSSTCVARVETDAGEGFLKAMGNPEGPHCLAAELVGTLLADWLGLPTFAHAIITVEPDDEIPLSGALMAAPGPAFLTKAEQGFPWGGEAGSLRRIRNPEDLAKLIVFDTWVKNCDRYRPEPNRRVNLDNVFLGRIDGAGMLQLLAIDHTHTFTCGRELTRRLAHIDEIQETMVYGCFPAFLPYVHQNHVETAVTRLRLMDAAQAAVFVRQVPAEWQVPADVRDAWIRFIAQRSAFVAANITSWLAKLEERK